MRAAIIAMLILMLPAALLAGQTMGVYFTGAPGQMWYSPAPFEYFKGYLYGHALNCQVSAIEFGLAMPPGIILSNPDPLNPTAVLEVPETSVVMGSLPYGVSVSYFPPLNGYYPGYNLLGAIWILALPDLICEGQNLPLQVIPHGDTGMLHEACYPENYLQPVIGLTSIICPDVIATEETSWGAIKSLF
jgi:hypothetical protein